MEYTKKYHELKRVFSLTNSRTDIDDEIAVINLPFNSQNNWQKIMDEMEPDSPGQLNFGVPDSMFFENNHFTYPVFIPRKALKYNRAILLLHGLNERSWEKYLTWAYYLSRELMRPVILFPIAFHMNRSPAGWIDPKLMISQANIRKAKYGSATLTYANAALSIRLTEDPLRFLKSGHQTADDLIALIKQMNQGLLPFSEKDTTVDVFAYSIGAFIAQIMLLAFPGKFFQDSRFFLFCGGSFFEDMVGTSRLIMDNVAYETVHNFYTAEIQNIMNRRKLLDSLLTEFPIGKAFYSMLSEDFNPMFRKQTCHSLKNRIYSLALEKDHVIPVAGNKKAMDGFSKNAELETMDFPFDYSHEVPFPSSGKACTADVDHCFNQVFTKAKEFLN